MRLRLELIVMLSGLAGCGGVTAEAPLTIQLGVHRDQATTDLRAAKYCHQTEGGLPQRVETYPRCERTGAEWAESWVTARYEADRLVELRRWERFTDDARALERWNQLIAERLKITPEAPDASAEVRAKGPLEPGTRSVKAFRVGAETVVAIYLLQPTPPQEASVLELIMKLPKP